MSTETGEIFSYKFPSDTIVQNRLEFYSLRRSVNEPAKSWYHRVQALISRCEFSHFIEFLLIDKYMCELDTDERKFARMADTWTAEQLTKYFGDELNGATLNVNGIINEHTDTNQEELLVN